MQMFIAIFPNIGNESCSIIGRIGYYNNNAVSGLLSTNKLLHYISKNSLTGRYMYAVALTSDKHSGISVSGLMTKFTPRIISML